MLLTGTDAVQCPYNLLEGNWLDAEHLERMEAVLSASAAGGRGPFPTSGLKPGDTFKIRGLGGEFFMKVAGIVDQPRTVRSFGVLYTSMAVAVKISGQAPHINRLNIGQRRGGIVRRIRRLGAGGGTDMFPGMCVGRLRLCSGPPPSSTWESEHERRPGIHHFVKRSTWLTIA